MLFDQIQRMRKPSAFCVSLQHLGNMHQPLHLGVADPIAFQHRVRGVRQASVAVPLLLLAETRAVKQLQKAKLQHITASGIRAEGITTDAAIRGDPQGRIDFKWAWNSTLPKSKLSTCGWAANPWVWVYRFRRCEKPKAF